MGSATAKPRFRRLRKLRYVAKHFMWIVRHPLNRGQLLQTLGRFLRWHLGSRLLRFPIAYPYANDLRMLVANGGNAVGMVHFGLDEYSEQAFCAHLLRPGDVFVDVGASDGSYALMASGIAGARSIAFEPEPAAAARLLDNVVLNRLEERIQIRRCAVGAAASTVRITTNLRTGNHVVVDGDEGSGSIVDVPCVALDAELAATAPTMIKVDVEGFEQAVLDGAAEVLGRDSLLAVILEDMQLGRQSEELSGQHRRMLDLGFRSYAYVPEERRLVDLNGKANQGRLNTLYVRNVSRVLERLAEAPAFRIRGRSI